MRHDARSLTNNFLNAGVISRKSSILQANNVSILSRDSFVESTNERIGRSDYKGPQHVEHLFRVRQLCATYGVTFKLNTVVNTFNKDEDMRDHVRELNPSRWKVFQGLNSMK